VSGIFGIIRPPGFAVADAELTQMADILKHRGPDGIRFSVRDNAGVGHCMLHSTPESLCETLPARDEASGLTVTADARIDNREQLMADIPLRPEDNQVVCDSQLILLAYMKWGEDCLDHLLGDFSFAIWEERTQSLFVGRDHMGCKPFYYHVRDGLFVFASSAMAVASIGEVRATLNAGRVADYLVEDLEGINNTCTWYNEISRMPPAHCGRYRNNRFQARQYWALEPTNTSRLKSDDDYLEAFTEVYTEAVRARLRCQAQPASMLSGGLDSSSIVALARDLLVSAGRPPLRTYSAISEATADCSESRSVEAIIAQGAIEPRCLKPAATDDYADDLDALSAVLEDPFEGSWTLLALMFLGAAQDGGRMLLTGVDGEHAVGAPSNYIAYLLRQNQWRKAWCEARAFSQHYYRGYYSPSKLYLGSLRSRLVPEAMRSFKRRLTLPGRCQRLVSEHGISRGFANDIDLQGRLAEYDRTHWLASGSTLQAWHQHAMQAPYLTAAIERYERLASYFGLETRHPLLDVRLLELSSALPLQYKVRGGWSKFMLRLLADDRLPDSVAWREGSEQLGWLFTAQRAKKLAVTYGFPLDFMEGSLSRYVEKRKLKQWQRGSGHGGMALTADSWRCYILCHWLQRMGPGASDKDG